MCLHMHLVHVLKRNIRNTFLSYQRQGNMQHQELTCSGRHSFTLPFRHKEKSDKHVARELCRLARGKQLFQLAHNVDTQYMYLDSTDMQMRVEDLQCSLYFLCCLHLYVVAVSQDLAFGNMSSPGLYL